MKSKGLINHSKETFVSPKVTQTLGFELESELLGLSKTNVVSVGHEIGGEYTISEDYWE